MTTSNHLRFSARAAAGLVLMAIALASTGGCDQGGEGDRCNPFLSHDECGDGLVCSGPSTNYPLPGTCVENYCCPTNPTKSSIPYCNGTDTTCPSPDAGPPASGDDGGDAAPE